MNRKDYWRTKTEVPHVSAPILPKTNISEIINGITSNKAICLIAPYGYGKTMSVISWLRESSQNAVWITLDAADNSQRTFYADLSAAMLRSSGWLGDMNDVLSDPRYIENPQDFFWETVSEVEKSGCERILVLDNFRYIDNHELQRSVKDMISGLLERWRVILMSRSELPPVFSELILRGQVCMITPNELSFSPEEMAEFFALNGCTASEEEILSIRSATGGWAASLNVVYMISRGGALVYNEAARGYVLDFFETEIWDGLDEHIKDFLLKTSVLDQLTPVACSAVTDAHPALPVLQLLFAKGLFISKLDEEGAYCYHQVFRDFLLYKLSKSGIDERGLYKKLGWWLFDNREIERSFPCFIKAGDLYGINQVLRVINPANMGGIDKYLQFAGCIVDLDIPSLIEYPLILAKITLIHFLTGDITKMRSTYLLFCEWIDLGVRPISPEEYAEFTWEEGWLNYLDPAVSTLNERNTRWVNDQLYLPEIIKKIQKDREAVLCFPTMMRGVRDCCDGLFELENFVNRIEAGEKDLVDEVISLWLTYVMLAEYHYERERFSEAESIIRKIMSQVEEKHLTHVYFMCAVLLVKIVRVRHDPEEIEALVRRLETMIMSSGHTFLLPNFHAFELRNRLAAGQAGFTDVFENENRDYEHTPYFYLIYRHFAFVRGLLSLGNYTRALLILGNLELLCQRYNRPIDLIEINILKSIALFNLGDADDARQHLISAINFSEPYGFIRIFSDEAKDIFPILELVQKQARGKFIQRIVISCKKTLARSGHKLTEKTYAYLELTKAELKVLRAVRNGMSYEEIAVDNSVRLSTIKSQLHSIYSKLEASNKTEAIIAAENLGILE